MKDNTTGSKNPPLLQALFELLWAHRGAFRQERTFRRAVAFVIAELFSFARHTVTQGLLALGLTDADWSAWYRLFSHPRYDEEHLARCLLGETLRQVAVDQVYVTAMDGVQVPRSSLKMPGTSWLRALHTAPFKRGLQRGQRFLNGSWLTPQEAGYSRAIPLRLLPILPEKAVPAAAEPCREWEGGLQFLGWVRSQLDAKGRPTQRVLGLGDAHFDTPNLWNGLPERVILAVRTARNRVLYALPQASPGKVGRPPLYGEPAPKPADWLKLSKGWSSTGFELRGRAVSVQYRVEGPFLRQGAPQRPLFLLVVRGKVRWVGKTVRQRKRWQPAFFLVSAEPQGETYVLPLPVAELLSWLAQRWELEVAHRELKSGLGLGEKQCWNVRSALTSVQWSAWVYAVLLLAGYRTWGLCGGPRAPARWWPGAKRWSLNTLWRAYRSAFWGVSQFRAIWTESAQNWLKMEPYLAGLFNAVLAAARA